MGTRDLACMRTSQEGTKDAVAWHRAKKTLGCVDIHLAARRAICKD
jgi:hypothetical protein